MPYKTIDELPDNVKALPAHAKEIYMKAFNAAFEQYKDRNNREALAHATAWKAVENSYEKKDGKWVSKEAVHPHGEHMCYCPDCEAEIEVAADVKCNTQECPECGTRMRAKDTGERRESMSDEDKREALKSALSSYYGIDTEATPKPSAIVVEEVFDDAVIYNIDGQSYRVGFELGEDGSPTLGEPEKVVRQTVYKPMESLRTRYAEFILETGRRNANLDAARIKKIVELCQELLSSEEEPDEKKTKEALKQVNAALKWLKEQDAMKTEDGEKYPASAFAYVPDSDKPSTWTLRLWQDSTHKVTKPQLGRAAAALSPGGFRGQKVDIPSEALSEVKRRVRSEYSKFGVDPEDMSPWVRETETREIAYNYIPLTEAKFDKGRAHVIIIKAGFNADKSRYYPAEMLKRDYKIFEGVKMYADHPTETEDKDRPERSIKDWAATLSNVTCDESATVEGDSDIIESWLMQKLSLLRDKGKLSEMGISINAVGVASKATIDSVETLVIEKLEAARSVDFVTEPGAGGIVTFYESDRNRNIDLIELAALKEKRPDLIKAVEAEVREEIKQEVKKHMENEERITELEGQVETLTTERDDLKNQITEAEKAKAKAEAQATIKEAVDEAELPDAAKERIKKRFEEAESADGIEEAIQTEKEYIAALTESGKVKNLGPSKEATEKDTEALKESLKRANPDWSEETLEIAVRG